MKQKFSGCFTIKMADDGMGWSVTNIESRCKHDIDRRHDYCSVCDNEEEFKGRWAITDKQFNMVEKDIKKMQDDFKMKDMINSGGYFNRNKGV